MVDSLHICPWWLGRVLDNPIRRLIHRPEKILCGYIERGQTVLDIGCGSGTFTLAMAKMVGDSGKVIAADVQDEMLPMVRKKAAKEGMETRIITHKMNRMG